MYKVTKHFEFEASHRLNALAEGHQCRNLHGHSYKVEVTIGSDKLNQHGFVIDFSEINQIKKRIHDDWDHALIISQNDPKLSELTKLGGKYFIFPYNNPSVENMCHHIYQLTTEMLLKKSSYRTFKVWIKIYETSNNFAEYTEE